MPLSAHIEPAGGIALEELMASAKLLVEGIATLIKDQQDKSDTIQHLKLAAEHLAVAATCMTEDATPLRPDGEGCISPTIEWLAETPLEDKASSTGLTMIGRGELFLRANKKRRLNSEPAARDADPIVSSAAVTHSFV